MTPPTTTATKTASTANAKGTACSTLHLALPKGRMYEGVIALLRDAGISVRVSERGYRPNVSLPEVETKILKPQNVIGMLASGTRDVGFAGADWIGELGVEDHVVELLDTGLDPVRIVVAAPESFLTASGELPPGHLRIATEYQELTRQWIESSGLDASVVRSFGATEVFPPEDADVIVDNTATGSTLRANKMRIIDDLRTSSTRLYASTKAWADPTKRARLEELVLLLRSVIDARSRVMVTMNVQPDQLEELLAILPCMKEPTVAELSHNAGYSVQSAVPRNEMAQLIPQIKARGGTDIIVSPVSQIIA